MDETKGHACFENAFRVGVHGPIHSASVPRQRMQSMDVLKFVAIFFVLWGHAEQYLLSGDYSDRMVYRHIYSFHMPLFMMISGFFFAMTVKPKVMENIIGKARQLLLPAVCWSVIFIVIAIVFTRQNLSFDSIRYGMMQSLWFLKSAFACSMLGLVPFLFFRRRHFGAACVVTLLLSQLLAVIPVINLPFMYPAFLVGGLIYIYHDRFQYSARWIIPVCCFVWIVCNVFLDGEAYRSMVPGLQQIPQSVGLKVAWRLYKYVMGLCGAVAFMALFEVIFAKPKSGRMISVSAEWGKMTLGIYVIQAWVLETALAHFVKFDGVPDSLFDFVISPLVALAVMAVCVCVIRLIRRNGFVSFLLLGTKWPASPKLAGENDAAAQKQKSADNH